MKPTLSPVCLDNFRILPHCWNHPKIIATHRYGGKVKFHYVCRICAIKIEQAAARRKAAALKSFKAKLKRQRLAVKIFKTNPAFKRK